MIHWLIGVHQCVETVCFGNVESSLQRVINVLVVDDSSACRMMTQRALSVITRPRCRICCDLASDGIQAIDTVKSVMKIESSVPVVSSSKSMNPSSKTRRQSIRIISAQSEYDLILMDYQMPHMDGPTAIRRIRELGFQGRIVGLTGNVLGSEIETMHEAGANKVLTKPVQLSYIESLVYEL